MPASAIELRRILVAVDFSELAETACQEATAMARRTGAELVLLHAVEPEGTPGGAGPSESGMLRAAREALDLLRLRHVSGEQVVSTHVAIGRPSDAICEAASLLDADLVVVGTHGRTGFRRILLGSVAERVVRLCERSVLVARMGAVAGEGYRQVLAATDFSAAAERAARVAGRLAARPALVRVLHYHDPLPSLSAGPDVAATAEQMNATYSRWASWYREELEQDGGIAVEFESQPGHPVRGLLERLDSADYDLVALGHSRHIGVRGRTIGTVAEMVVRHAGCSALVVPATA